MSDGTVKKFPGWFYGPNGEAQVFDKVEDVPKGWQDDPNKFGSRKEEEPADPPLEHGGLTRQQIIDDLQRREIKYKVTQTTAALYRLLEAAIEAQS